MLEAGYKYVPVNRLAAHFHNTYGQALVNLYAVIEEGLIVIDSFVAGLGGCPHAPGASGNIATEDVVFMLEGMGIKTGINMDELLKAATFIYDRSGISSNSGAEDILKLRCRLGRFWLARHSDHNHKKRARDLT